jgi:hypothetical protein
MKTDSKNECLAPAHQRLLRDIFAEDFHCSDGAGQDTNQLMREFRRVCWRRKATRAVLAAALVILGILASLYTREIQRPTDIAALSTPAPARSTRPSSPVAAGAMPPAPSAAYLSDQQLLDLFPPNSCFLVELNGKQVLVFQDGNLATGIFR